MINDKGRSNTRTERNKHNLKVMEWFYRILHIDTEIANGKANVVAEWQGELVRCKDCRFWKNEHLCLVMSRYGSIDTKAEHYCSWGERREP